MNFLLSKPSIQPTKSNIDVDGLIPYPGLSGSDPKLWKRLHAHVCGLSGSDKHGDDGVMRHTQIAQVFSVEQVR